MTNDNRKILNLPKLILASGSPRRAEILGFTGWEFEKRSADIDERERVGEDPSDYVRRLAREKAQAVAAEYDRGLILGADTTVVIDGRIIGKPRDLDEAREMIRALSGRWHKVLTGIALVKKEGLVRSTGKTAPAGDFTGAAGQSAEIAVKSPTAVGVQTTDVRFADLSDGEVEFLVTRGEPLDKAGAYAVQAEAALFIEEIRGDYWNVVGLPINLVYKLIRDIC